VNSEIDILQNKELVGQVIDELRLDVPSPPPPFPATGRLAQIRWYVKDTMTRLREWQNELFIRLGLRPRLGYRERVLSLLSDGLIVLPQKDSNVIVARMFVGVREGGSLILNKLLDRYLTYRLAVWRGSGANDFFSSELERSRGDLEAAEAALAGFEQEHNIVALQTQQQVLVSSISQEEERVRYAAIDLDAAEERLRRVTGELSKPEPDFAAIGQFPEGSFADTAMQQLSALERQREALKLTELDGSVRLTNLTEQFKSVFENVVSNVRAAAAEKKAVHDTRSNALLRMRDELQALHTQESEWTNLKRQVSLAEQNYLKYTEKVRETAGLDELDARHLGNVVIIERATDALRPAGTRKLTLLSAALTVVLLAAFAFMAIAEFFDHRIYSPEMLEALVGAPTIGTIPAVKAARLRHTLPALPSASAQLS
jgi:uncharacterized protein involved in exopolysaccharide biosynthesis